jgi:hypothetical protein
MIFEKTWNRKSFVRLPLNWEVQRRPFLYSSWIIFSFNKNKDYKTILEEIREVSFFIILLKRMVPKKDNFFYKKKHMYSIPYLTSSLFLGAVSSLW